ncbi:hypothetical protein D3C83_295710 [compost metagenome]
MAVALPDVAGIVIAHHLALDRPHQDGRADRLGGEAVILVDSGAVAIERAPHDHEGVGEG